MITRQHQAAYQEGFTIIELMIATTVLSVILLLATTTMISIGNLYYKGVNQARIQDGVRSVVDDVSQRIQFSKSDVQQQTHTITPPGLPGINIYAFCIGDTRYNFVLNRQIGSSSSQISHVLWRDNINDGALCEPLDISQSDPESGSSSAGTNGTELISPNSELTAFYVGTFPGRSGDIIQVGMAYGDPSLLVGPIPPSNPQPVPTFQTCPGGTGDQFCATDSLNSRVVQR